MNTSKERTRDEILVLENGRILDVENERFIERGVIIVRDKLISDIGSRGEVEIPKNVETIDLKGNVVLPGLIDAHIHLTT
jgi:Imidazolonepropionase and related amidohydrolases